MDRLASSPTVALPISWRWTPSEVIARWPAGENGPIVTVDGEERDGQAPIVCLYTTNGGITTEVAQFLVKVKTAEEVMEYSSAFLQLYREEGWYLERTVHYVNRVGLDYVKQRVLEDAAGRKALYERLQFALKDEPDPWAERVAGADQAAAPSHVRTYQLEQPLRVFQCSSTAPLPPSQ